MKKLLLAVVMLFFAQSCFAVDVQELNIEFFTRFNDENLNCYIQQALDNNHELKKAAHVLEQYRQQTKYSLGRELPSLSVSANYLGVKVPELDNFQLKDNAFILPLMASYEADFLLKNRDKTKAVKKTYEAAQFNEKAIYLALLSDVATVYTNILQYDDLIEKQTEQLKNQEEILKRSNKKFERGVINSTELNNAKKSVETSKSSLEKLQKEREIAMMQLAVLTGNSSSNISDMKVGNLDNFEYSGEIPNEISSDVFDLKYVTSHWFNLKQILMIGFIAKTNKQNFILSSEVDSAEWVPIKDIPKKIYPEHPDNLAYTLYRKYLNNY